MASWDKKSVCFIPYKGAPQTQFVKPSFFALRGLRGAVDIPRSPFQCFITL